MFQSAGAISFDNLISEQQGSDLKNEDNAVKWRGLFKDSLAEVLARVHVTLTASDDALQHVESLIIQLLLQLCYRPQPHCVQDLVERVERMFPSPINKWSVKEARCALEKGKKRAALVLPVERVHTLLNKEVFQHRVDFQVSLFLTAVLEYIADDILTLVGKYKKNIRHVNSHVITTEHIKTAISADQVLLDVFEQDDGGGSCGTVAAGDDEPLLLANCVDTNSVHSYEQAVRDILVEERAYQRTLSLMMRVFRAQVRQLPHVTRQDLDAIFGNIDELYECTVKLVGQLDDALEMAEGGSQISVGHCFEELAEDSEFDVYERYCEEVVVAPPGGGNCQTRLWQLLDHSRQLAATTTATTPPSHNNSNNNNGVATVGHGFLEAVKYVLPRLLMLPVSHALSYFDSIKLLYRLSKSADDQETLEQVQGMLKTLEMTLERALSASSGGIGGGGAGGISRRRLGDPFARPGRCQRMANLHRMREIQSSIEGWEGKDISQSGCSELIAEGVLGKVGGGGSRKLTERHVFLFDGLMLLCKPNARRAVVSVTGAAAVEYRLKERLYVRKLEVLDRPHSDELPHSFELVPRAGPSLVLFATSGHQKTEWMASLVMLTTKSMLERSLDMLLLAEEKKNPLRLPEPELYRFAEPDSVDNIVMEELESSVPLIKGATLTKLVERLTYHMYADPMFVRTFLTTFRSFCTAQELLSLLMQRYEIPDPASSSDLHSPLLAAAVSVDQEEPVASAALLEGVKRFRKEYCQPVKFRVLNVLRHWVDHHFYDFERDPELLHRLRHFIAGIRAKVMRKWSDSILKIIDRKTLNGADVRPVVFGADRSPPPVEWHLVKSEDECTFTAEDIVRPLLVLHPIELGRQLTLLEFDLYCAVRSAELVGAVWTKQNKHRTSPNLLRMIRHNTNITRWLERCVVECECLEERRAVVCRLIELSTVLFDLNNFSGVLEVVAALNSAAVHRLSATFEEIPPKLERLLCDARDFCGDHYKRYQEKLRSINPPCVPFFGMYLTNILHIDEGNPDFLSGSDCLINFSKLRKVAEITGEIQQFQNLPYCLHTVPAVRAFLENLQPFDEAMSTEDINTYLYTRSLAIEPRNCRVLPKQSRQWPDLPLKSPGTKARALSVLRSSLPIVIQSCGDPVPGAAATAADSTPRVLTPPTPASSSTVSSPPHSASICPPPTPALSLSPVTPRDSVAPPPPLPPRSRRSCRLPPLVSPGVESQLKQAPDAPRLPPRSCSPPPPRPPRRNIPPPLTAPPATLPRRVLPSASPSPGVISPCHSCHTARSAGHLSASACGTTAVGVPGGGGGGDGLASPALCPDPSLSVDPLASASRLSGGAPVATNHTTNHTSRHFTFNFEHCQAPLTTPLNRWLPPPPPPPPPPPAALASASAVPQLPPKPLRYSSDR